MRDFFSELHKAYLVARIPRPSPLAVLVLPWGWYKAVRRCTGAAMMFGFLRNPTRGWMVAYGLTGFAAGFVWPLWALPRFPGSFVRNVRAFRKALVEQRAKQAEGPKPT